MNVGPLQQTLAEGQPLGAVVVAADDEDGDLPRGKAAEKIVEEGHGLGGGDGLVVNVAADQHGVGLFVVDDAQDLEQDIFLVLDHGHLVDPLADVQVRQMDQFHGLYLPDVWGYYTAENAEK